MVNGRKHAHTTKVKSQTNDPKFNETFQLYFLFILIKTNTISFRTISNSHEARYEKKGELIVEVWDWDRLSPDDFMYVNSLK